MDGYTPGKRIKSFFSSSGEKVDAVVGNKEFSEIKMPENPGPAIAGRTPAIGSVRRQKDMPVVRDEVADLLDR